VIAATGAGLVAGFDDCASTSDTALLIRCSLGPPACHLTVFTARSGGGCQQRYQTAALRNRCVSGVSVV
jgi:hypothetical protein